jgi:hypothetical protein
MLNFVYYCVGVTLVGSVGELNPPSNLPKKVVLDETIHVQKDVRVGGNFLSKLIFVSVLLLLGLSLMYMLSQNDIREGRIVCICCSLHTFLRFINLRFCTGSNDGDNTGVTRWLTDFISSNYFWSKEKERKLVISILFSLYRIRIFYYHSISLG